MASTSSSIATAGEDSSSTAPHDPRGAVSGDAEISAAAADSKIVIRTTSRLAGAIDSLTFRGREYIDSHDHGRQLQSAASFSDGRPGFVPETYNPTEAGSRHDGAGPTSTSRLLMFKTNGNRLETRTQMAFWLRPGERSEEQLARNRTALSDYLLRKRVTIGYRNLSQVLEYVVTFTIPSGASHRYAQCEAVTGYMPNEFSKFWVLDLKTGKLRALSDGPGEQRHPVILATPDGRHAMGAYSPQQPSPSYAHVGYGRFRFAAQKVVKWNVVFRRRSRTKPLPTGDYTFRTFVAVGTLDEVRSTLLKLAQLEPPRASK